MSDDQLLTELQSFLTDDLLRLWIKKYIEGNKDENDLISVALETLEQENEIEET